MFLRHTVAAIDIFLSPIANSLPVSDNKDGHIQSCHKFDIFGYIESFHIQMQHKKSNFLTRYAVNTGWWEIDIHDCYSLVQIAFAPIYACKNNRQIWRHNASISRSRDVTDLLWWRHNAKSETTVLSDSCEMSDRWLFLAELCVQDIK